MTRQTTSLITRAGTALALAAALTVGASAGAFAQEKHIAPVIGVVDTDYLLRELLAAKGVQLEREKYATAYQGQIKDTEAKLRAEDQQITQDRQSAVVAQDVMTQRAQAFQQKLASFQAEVKDKQDRLDYSFQQAMQEIGNTIMVISSEVAKTDGINAVFARSQLMIFDPSMDITKPVLEKLNQRLASVKFQDPATLQRPAGPGAPGAPGAAIAGAAPQTPAAAAAATPAKKAK